MEKYTKKKKNIEKTKPWNKKDCLPKHNLRSKTCFLYHKRFLHCRHYNFYSEPS